MTEHLTLPPLADDGGWPPLSTAPAAVRRSGDRRRVRQLAVAGAAIGAAVLAVGTPGIRSSVGDLSGRIAGQSVVDTTDRDAAAVLDEVLPPALGDVTTKQTSDGPRIEAIAPAGRFPITFNISRWPEGSVDEVTGRCRREKSVPNFTYACAEGQMPDGTPVAAQLSPTDDGGQIVAVPGVSFIYRGALVQLFLFPAESGRVPVPITVNEMLAAVTDYRFVGFLNGLAADPARLAVHDRATVAGTADSARTGLFRPADPNQVAARVFHAELTNTPGLQQHVRDRQALTLPLLLQ